MPLPSPDSMRDLAPPDRPPPTLRPRLDLFSVFVYVVVAGGIATQFALIAWLARR